MSFYPIFNILNNKGFLRLSNFPPNDWEKAFLGLKKIYSYASNGLVWEIEDLGKINENSFASFEAHEFHSLNSNWSDGTLIEELVLLEMRTDTLPTSVSELPSNHLPSTHWPEWRATIGFKAEDSRVSYQGEINPTPPKATLLTFHPFIQFDDINNYFVFVNIEKSPIHRWSEIDIYLSESGKKIDTKRIRNNAANIIPLDEYGFTSNDLPVFYCKSMAGIPFGFGKSKSTGMLSLEHTHPPASLTLHGNRLFAQKDIKTSWAKSLKIG